ncbi:RsmB/NOP family class I SAM-dependent RNA methyltransferase [Gallaecimonas sp. GXIMD4217]|uniref:RsmB/NOP family class I SAM-dependent RNA methyltransferase n=1 Tax=Gallaecimonas sp. GXIMD4217 TaxID=3131927 RepID=UPI00311B3171
MNAQKATDSLKALLEDVLLQGHPLDKVLQRLLPTLPAPARPWLAESGQHLVRFGRRYAFLAGVGWPLRHKGEIPLLLSAWQRLERPAQALELPRLRGVDWPARLREAKADGAVWHSFPQWLDERAQAELGDGWPPLRAALNRPPAQYLRANTLVTDAKSLHHALHHEKVPTRLEGEALKVQGHRALFKTKAFHQGAFEQQDLGSQQVAPFLEVTPGMTVIDACAGAGGKTLHLAALMANRGRLLAMDIFEGKLKALKKRARRAGIHNLESRHIEGSATIKRLKGKADRLLLDVPCSGTGVLRRNPDGKWQLQAADLDQLLATQAEILDSYARMLKAGGKLVYATCSILPSENEAQVAAFLARHPGRFLLEAERRLQPDQYDGDGFYMARLVKID